MSLAALFAVRNEGEVLRLASRVDLPRVYNSILLQQNDSADHLREGEHCPQLHRRAEQEGVQEQEAIAHDQAGLELGKSPALVPVLHTVRLFDEEQNINKDELTRFDKPFYSLIRDDLWVLDPLSMTVRPEIPLNA